MATIHDVAKLAGVAPITVSRVINQAGYISQETRERVESAINELGYVPNTLARSLRSKRTNTLALVLTDITNPYWTTVARGVEDTASESGYTVFFCNTDESNEKELNYLRVLLEKQVDGILLVPALSSPESALYVQRQNTPIVILDRRIPEIQADIVRADSEQGSYKLTELLISQGHRRIAFLGGPMGVSTAEDRRNGFHRAVEQMNDVKNPFEITEYSGKYSYDSGYEMALQLFEHTPRPTAVIATNNFIANGAMRAFRDKGIQVPDDISLVGFDDIPAPLNTIPFLTVVSQPAYEMGKISTEILLSRLKKGVQQPFQEVVLPVGIIVRHSSKEMKS
jgi:LacI family transcriptional regulator